MSVNLFLKDKVIKAFIIREINEYYELGTYLGKIYRKKVEINKLIKSQKLNS